MLDLSDGPAAYHGALRIGAQTGSCRLVAVVSALCALVTHARKVVHDADAAVNWSRIGEHVSNQQVDEKAMVLSPRQEHLQRLRDDMAPGNQPAAIVPRTFAELITMCQALAAADLAPKALRGKATDMALVIMTGAEVGLPPMASLRLYTTWDGVPRLMAEGIRAIMLQSPVVEYFEVATCDDNHATWIGKRRGRGEKSATWTVERAKKAELLSKENWRKYTQDMLNARASMQLARMIAPDVVAGMVALEEARDDDFIDVQGTEAKPQFVAPPPPPQVPPPGVPQTDAKIVAIGTVTVADTGSKPAEQQKRGPGRPPGSKNAERPTTPAGGSAPSSGSGSASAATTQPPQNSAPAPTSQAAPGPSPESSSTAASSPDPTSAAGGSVQPSSAAPTSETPSTASTESSGAPPDDGFGGEDPEDSQLAPTGDPGLTLIAEFQAFLATPFKNQAEMQAGRPPFAQRAAALFKDGDQRFAAPGNGKPAGELAARMGQLWAERKSQVPA